ncbi:MAG: tetraacyldisaccharide 4'-kinase [Motiliproteus sp.]
MGSPEVSDWFEQRWYGTNQPLRVLAPLEWLFNRVAKSRRQAYASGKKPSYRAAVPVIIVGNISVGGTGKTPFTLWLLEVLRASGFRPGVVSRGYGGKAAEYPYEVTQHSPAAEAGDEPLMLVQRSGCPLVVDPDRGRAAARLLELHDCDLIVSDDGLQHYALARDIEIAVVDRLRGLGNGRCLPVGPLRESVERLNQVDYVVLNGASGPFDHTGSFAMTLQPGVPCRFSGEEVELAPQSVHAVAGIGNPQRFFDTLETLGYQVEPHAFPDHYKYREQDLNFHDNRPVLMTEKDAVKCRAFATDNRYYLPVTAQLPLALTEKLIEQVEALAAHYANIRTTDG